MSEFQTSAELSISVSKRELSNVRREIEDELSDVSLGIKPSMGSASGSAGAGGGDMNGRERRRRRREFRWARQRTGDMEDAVALLEDIEDKVGTGGGGGFLGDALGGGVDLLGDFGSEFAGTAADSLTDIFTGTISTALGTTISNAINGSSVSVEDTQLGVDDPSPLSVEETILGVEDTTLPVEPVDPLKVEELDPLLVDDPSPLQVEDVPNVQVERPSWKIGVERPGPIRIDVNATGGGGGSDRNIPEIKEAPGIVEQTQKRAKEFDEKLPPFVLGGTIGALYGFGEGVGAQLPGSKAQKREAQSRRRRREALQRGGGSTGEGGTTTVQVQQQTDITANVDITVDTKSIVKDTVDAFEKEISKVEKDLQRQIDDLERRIERATRR